MKAKELAAHPRNPNRRKKRESLSSPRRILAVQKQEKALRMRQAGLTFAEIGRQLGYADRQGAEKAVAAALQKTIAQPAEDLRQLDITRLDALLHGAWDEAVDGDPRAIDSCLKVLERRAKLLGLDKAVEVHVQVQAKPIAELSDEELAQTYAHLVTEGYTCERCGKLNEPRPALVGEPVKMLTEGQNGE